MWSFVVIPFKLHDFEIVEDEQRVALGCLFKAAQLQALTKEPLHRFYFEKETF